MRGANVLPGVGQSITIPGWEVASVYLEIPDTPLSRDSHSVNVLQIGAARMRGITSIPNRKSVPTRFQIRDIRRLFPRLLRKKLLDRAS